MTPPAKAQSRKPARRNRIPLSCEPCRLRKLKCNREKPCQNCAIRNEQGACHFRSSGMGIQPTSTNDAHIDTLRQRIDHLEALVKKIAADRPNSSTIDDATTHVLNDSKPNADLPEGQVGETVIAGNRSIYHSGSDWDTILEEVNELKRTWGQLQTNQSYPQLSASILNIGDGTGLLFNQIKPTDCLEILSSLPSKSQTDKLIARFFDLGAHPITIPPLLHKATFMNEYDAHWKDPSKSGFIWLGLLFSILGIIMLEYNQYDTPPEYEGITEPLFQLYRMRTAQCLLNGDIAKCIPYTLETLRFNATAELNRKDDNRRGLWITSGVIIRTAINMGYHRDASNNPSISTLQAEYRRRTWLSVISMDNMVCFRGGFPRMTTTVQSSAKEPCNLHDWELSEDAKALPPSRPLSEHTAVTYLIVKGRLLQALGLVVDLNHSPIPCPYERVLEIDKALMDAYDNSPSDMKVSPTTTNGDYVRPKDYYSNLNRFCMYHRGKCALHRKFLAKGRAEGLYQYSRDRCISSALEIMAVQDSLKPSFYKYYHTREMLAHAAMILILELELRRVMPTVTASPESSHLVQILSRSCNYWAEATNICTEAQKIHELMVGILSNWKTTIPNEAVPSSTGEDEEATQPPDLSFMDQIFSSGVPFETDISNMDFDWSTWDTFIE